MFFRQLASKESTLSYFFGCGGKGRAVAVDVVAGDEQWFIDEAKKAGVTRDPDVRAEMALAEQTVLVESYLHDWLKKHPITDAVGGLAPGWHDLPARGGLDFGHPGNGSFENPAGSRAGVAPNTFRV